MPKKEQQKINDFVIQEWNKAYQLFMKMLENDYCFDKERLYSCKAMVYKYDNYMILQSYNCIVALIDIESRIFIDALRLEYGYTPTSCQHIAKFKKKYSEYFDENSVYVWRELK